MSSSSMDQPFYLTENRAFSTTAPEDELLHPEKNKIITDTALTETQYFGFSIPEAEIQGVGYFWHHANLGVVSGGTYVWHGDKQTAIAAELCAYTNFMSDRILTNDLRSYRFENGYGVEVLEPLRRHRMTYSDTSRKNSIDLVFEALAPPVMFGDGNHMEQPMKVKGEILLRGSAFTVDCFNMRDRSWARPRREENMSLPPMSWMTGIFNEGFCFCCNIFDQASQNKELVGPFALSDEKTLPAGWIYRAGKLTGIVRARKRVERDPRTRVANVIELELTDKDSHTTKIRGTRLKTSFPWLNNKPFNVMVCTIKWECDGFVTYGENQEAQFSDYVSHFSR